MRTIASLSILLAALVLSGCKGRSAVVDICLGPDGNSQDCGIACKVTKDKEACAEWEKKTVAICEKISKEECQEICAKDKNPKACELAKAK